nr:TetR/AcrR family transcriptional regulator [Propionicimonas sp.]
MPRPARYAKGLAKREEILTTALEVIARTGYRRTSVRELAAAVGLSQAGLLHYFASKEDLFAEILLKRDDVDLARADSDNATPLEAMVSIVRHNAEVPGLMQLSARYSIEATDPDHPGHAAIADRYAGIRQLLIDDIETRKADGRLPAHLDAERSATLMIAAADGLQTQWLMDPGLDMAGHLAYLVSLLGSVPAPAEGQPTDQ